MSVKYKFVSIFLITWIFSSFAYGQEDFNHPELDWRTIETEHFLVHYHNGAERTGQEVAKIAESIYEPVTTIYNHKPDQKVSFFIKDYMDISNGAAYFFENRIEILAPALDYELRGIHPWLWDVVSHEFTHIVQIQTSLKFGRKIWGIYFQWLGYESERRPDVLYGYPNVLVSYPFSGFISPSWFAEGIAQYNNPTLGYDYWDSHRDMILRMYIIDGNPLSWEEMAKFGKKTLGNESSYNAGFSIVEYIANNYGIEKLQDISRRLSAPFCLTIDNAIYASLGKTGIQLYDEWKSAKSTKYKHLADSLKYQKVKESFIENMGEGNFYPVFSPNGKRIAYISDKNVDYWSLSSIYSYDCTTKKTDLITNGVRSSISYSPDEQYIYYGKMTYDNPNFYFYGDIFRYNISKEKEERLTYSLRAFNPKLSSDGKKIVFAFGNDGTLNIGTCNEQGKNIRKLTNFQNGEQVYTPVLSIDGSKIAFGYSTGHNQSIAMIDSDGTNFRILPLEGDSRNPFFASDSILYFSWDKGGIFNIYSTDLRNGFTKQITHVAGGAFLPTLNNNNDLVYVTYTSSGYKIASYKEEDIGIKTFIDTLSFKNSYSQGREESNNEIEKISLSRIDSISNKNVIYQTRQYKYVFTSLALIPFIRIDNYNENSSGLDIIKPGLYITSSDVLDKISLNGGGAINRKLERDLFLIFEFKDRLPLLYQLGLAQGISIELYNITRKRDVSFDLYVDNLQTFNTDVTYNLFEFDFSITGNIANKCPLSFTYSLDEYSQDFGSWVHPRFGAIQASRSTYFIGNAFSARMKYDGITRTLDKDINPIGRTFSIKYSYEIDKFNPKDSSDVNKNNGFRFPVYTKYYFSKLELNWSEHIALPIPKHTFSVTLNAAGIFKDSVDEFFDYYAGGFIGMRGYPFYAIGGNKMIAVNAAYRFPIETKINFRLLQFYFTKLYGSFFYDIGDAWYNKVPSINDWKRDVGFELRLEAFSYYVYPTRIFFSGAYGLDKFSRNVQDIKNVQKVMYGNEWRFYLGILFGFELNDIFQSQIRR